MTRGREGATGDGAVPSGAAAFTVRAAHTWAHRVALLMASHRYCWRWQLVDAIAVTDCGAESEGVGSRIPFVNEHNPGFDLVFRGELHCWWSRARPGTCSACSRWARQRSGGAGIEGTLQVPFGAANAENLETSMDRDMFPRTVVRIGLVEHLLDRGRQDLLAAVMAFCCRQSRSTVPCKDVQTLQAWCRVSPNWWTVHGTEVMALIPPLGGGSWGFEEIERAWKAHEKFAEKGMKGGLISGAVRGFEGRRRKKAGKRSPASSPASSQLEAVQSQGTTRASAPAPSPLAVSASQGANALVASSDGSGVGGPPSSATNVLRHEDRRITTHCPECWNTCSDWLMEKPGSVPYCGNCGCDFVEGSPPAGMHPGVKIALKAQDAMDRELARLRANVSNIVAVPAAAAAEPTPIRVLPTTPKAASMLKARVKTVTVKTPVKSGSKLKKRTA